MSYSKIFEIEGEEAKEFIDVIDENGPESLLMIILNTIGDEWNEREEVTDIPVDDMDDSYIHENHILLWDKDRPLIQFYVDGNHEQTERVISDEDDNSSDIVDEALGDDFLKESIKSLQEGDSADLEYYISNKVKNIIRSTIND